MGFAAAAAAAAASAAQPACQDGAIYGRGAKMPVLLTGDEVTDAATCERCWGVNRQRVERRRD